jgi:hypothetical protein
VHRNTHRGLAVRCCRSGLCDINIGINRVKKIIGYLLIEGLDCIERQELLPQTFLSE